MACISRPAWIAPPKAALTRKQGPPRASIGRLRASCTASAQHHLGTATPGAWLISDRVVHATMEAPALPRHVQLEVTGACNLRCRMCLVRYAPAVSRNDGALSFEDYLAVVDALPQLERVTLQGLGEPLLSPHLEAMIEHAAARGVRVGFNSNGVLL